MEQKGSKGDKGISVLKFLITYIVLMGLFVLLIGLEPMKKIVDINGLYTTMIVLLSDLALKPFGIVKGISGSVISLKGVALDVRFGCNGLEAFLIYTVAILSFPASIKKKIIGITGGFVVLQALNIMRIAGLGLSGIYLRKYFYYIHIYVAQGIMIALALICFLLWLNYATEK